MSLCRGAGSHGVERLWVGAICSAGALVGLVADLNYAAQPATPAAGARPAAKQPFGWYARFSAAAVDPKGKKPEAIVAYTPQAAFALKAGETAYPGVPAAGFEAIYDADVRIADPGKYRFGAEVQGGKVQINVLGKGISKPLTVSADRPPASGAPVLTDWVGLPVGTVTVQIVFNRAGDAPARLRAVWEMDRAGMLGFDLEPIAAPNATVASYGAAETAAARAVFDGRILLGQMGCVNCHDAGAGLAAVGPVAKGPVLSAAGAGLYHDWVRKWIAAPQEIEPGCGMPTVLGDSAKDRQDVEAITHFVVSRGGPAPYEAAATEAETLKMGRDMYHTVGCVACHGPLEVKKNAPAFTPPEPFGHLAGKFRPSALADFLHDPAQSHPHGGMPSLSLSHAEADLVATYLINVWGRTEAPPAFSVDPAKAKAGQAAFAARGCAACHEVADGGGPVASTLKAKPMSQLRLGKGCLDARDKATPRYTLEDDDRAALAAALGGAKSWATSGAIAPVDACLRTAGALGCTHCHEFNGEGGAPDAIKKLFSMTEEADLGDEGRIPPRLTGVGGKLNTPWLKAVLTEGGRARPYMATRMPQFAAGQVHGLAEGLAAADGVWPNSDRTEPRASQDLVQAGRKLVGDTGLNCIACHVYGGEPPTGTPGVAITAMAARLRYDWFARYVINPGRGKPGTKMTNFFTTNGTSAITEVFGGEGHKQADAMWAYFTLGEFMPAPAGIQQAKGLQIRVGDRPRVMRTFMKNAGSRGIAVGYPEAMGGVHFAFDAEAVRLVEAWRGDFLDASGAWANRGGTIVGGQGGRVWSAPKGLALVVGTQPKAWAETTGREAGLRFRGYTLDERGIPTIMYDMPRNDGSARGISVRERFEPTGAATEGRPAGIRRAFEVSGIPMAGEQTIWFNAGRGQSAMRTDPGVQWQTVKRDDGSVWYGLNPSPPWVGESGSSATASYSFSVEITP